MSEIIKQIPYWVVNFIVMLILGFIYKQIKQVFRKVDYSDIKHDALVHALQRESKNGFYGYYKEYLDQQVKKDDFIHKS